MEERKNTYRITTLLSAAALVATLTGCADQRVAGGALDAARAAARGPMSDGELREAVLDGDESPTELSGPEDAPYAAPVVARDPDCEGLARLLSAGLGSPYVRAHATAVWSSPDASARTTLAIASFAKGGAQAVVDEGMGALDRCLTFARAATVGGPEQAPQCVPVPEAGDMSLGLVLAAPDGTGSAEEAATGYVIVRVGDILTVFGHQTADGLPTMPDRKLVEQQVARITARLA
ncbi:hypothetical protein LO772_21755 [Yinghuangia sp. ASG 101]|uniref:hypothetical protein n=1 Tax=Yinghuangia sp. ASG 101 TaxID=2896848 RepID=UPI001E2FE4F0|nr:hypothetical protein [Yinghuangia sp. ASG 101]UGQ09550.1 hypothetical protein LO772_21755 [Yinghuangia sp. ASG 101]